jgi:hypothetical protein
MRGAAPIVVAQAVMLAALAVLPLLDDAPVSDRGRPVVEGQQSLAAYVLQLRYRM